MEQIFGEQYEEFTSFKAVKIGPSAESTSSKPRPLKTASAAQPAPPHAAKPRQDIARPSMSMLSRAISRNVNEHEVARMESKRRMKEALSKSDEPLHLPLEQQSGSVSTTEYIDLTSE